jgi:hypothetical protein
MTNRMNNVNYEILKIVIVNRKRKYKLVMLLSRPSHTISITRTRSRTWC